MTSDIYAIGYDGTGYRRITNSPACAVLRHPAAGRGDGRRQQLHEHPDMGLCGGRAGGQMGQLQRHGDYSSRSPTSGRASCSPAIGVWGLSRFVCYPPPDARTSSPVRQCPAGTSPSCRYSGFQGFGAGKVSWKGRRLRARLCPAEQLRPLADLRQPVLWQATGVIDSRQPAHECPTWLPGARPPPRRTSISMSQRSNLLDEGYHGHLAEQPGRHVWRREARWPWATMTQ